jgi:hypothetical protein
MAIRARSLVRGVSNCSPNSIKWVVLCCVVLCCVVLCCIVLCWLWCQEEGVRYRLDPTEWAFYLMTETALSPKRCFKYKYEIHIAQISIIRRLVFFNFLGRIRYYSLMLVSVAAALHDPKCNYNGSSHHERQMKYNFSKRRKHAVFQVNLQFSPASPHTFTINLT